MYRKKGTRDGKINQTGFKEKGQFFEKGGGWVLWPLEQFLGSRGCLWGARQRDLGNNWGTDRG